MLLDFRLDAAAAMRERPGWHFGAGAAKIISTRFRRRKPCWMMSFDGNQIRRLLPLGLILHLHKKAKAGALHA